MAIRRFLPLLVAFGAASFAPAQTPYRSYELNGTYAPTIGGGDPLTPNGGTLGPTSYRFGINQGLTLPTTNLDSLDNYTIQMRFSFDEVTGYRRILDVKDGTSDSGYYVRSGGLAFYNTVGASGTFDAFTPYDIVFVRDSAAQEVRGYIDGNRVYTFSDTTGLGIFDGTSARFFIDDNAVGGEASAGTVDAIRFYSGALNDAQVATIHNYDPAVPEPATLAALGLGAAALVRRRRRA